jgi:Putative beta-lactamase-inhibitor-like, PepSY-like
MKMHKFVIGAAIVMVAAGCESTRQTTTSETGSATENRSATAANNDMPTVNQNAGISSTTTSSGQPVNPAQTGQTATTGGQTGTSGQVTQSGIPQPPATPSQPTPSAQQHQQNTSGVSGNVATQNSSNAQDTIVTPPSNIQSAFRSRFPNVTDAKWSYYDSTNVPIDWDLTGWPRLTNRDYSVMYNVDGTTNYAWYDAQGNWVGSSSAMKDFMNLPAPVSKMLATKYPGYKIEEVHTETYKDQSGYEIEMNKGADKVKMVVDANGKVLKLKTKTADSAGNVNKEKTKN